MVQIAQMREGWGKFLKAARPFVKPVLIVFGIIMLGMLAILRANFSYMDDLARATQGYKGWGNFSRYLSNFLAIILYGNGFLTDISPWGQIVAGLLMAIAGVMLLYIIYDRKKFRWWELLVVAMLALNPYFLQCLSYKFDAPFMAVAVLMMIVPFLARKAKSWVYVGVVLVGTLATCMTYQAALGILPMVMTVLAVRMWGKGEEWGKIWRFVLRTVVGYGIGLVIFKVFIMRLVEAYVVTEMPGLMEIIPHTLGNLRQYYELVAADFTKIWLVAVVLTMVWFVVMMVVDAKKQKWVMGVVAVVTVMVLMAMAFGIYIVMEKPLFEPRAMLGVGAMICLLAVVVAEERQLKGEWRKYVSAGGIVVAVVLMYLFGMFSFTYGNALAVQKEYTDFRIEAVVNDLEGLVKEGNVVEVVGNAGLAPALMSAVGEYPLLGRLVPTQFAEGYWGQYTLMRYYGMRGLERDLLDVPVVEDYPIVEEHWHHNLRMKDGVVVVEVKGRE